MTLDELQRSMAAAVMQPLTPSDEMQPYAPNGRPMSEVAGSLIAPNSRLTSFERLEIYNRQYWYRVLGSLREDFTGLRAILGSRRFEALSIAYLAEHPSRSFTLRNLGSNLAQWLARHPEHAGRRHALAVDVAMVEWAFVEAFDAGDRPPLTREEIGTLSAESKIDLQPHLRLLELGSEADDLVVRLHNTQSAGRQTSEAGVSDEDPEVPPARLGPISRRPTWVAAHRVDLAVYYLRLSREEFLTLQAIGVHRTLGEALQAGFAGSRVSPQRQVALIQKWFAAWAELGWLCAPDLERLVEA